MYIESPASPSVYSTLPAACLRRPPSARAHAAAVCSHGRTAWAEHSRHLMPCRAMPCCANPSNADGERAWTAALRGPSRACAARAQQRREHAGAAGRAIDGGMQCRARIGSRECCWCWGQLANREGVRKLGGARLRRTVVLGRLPLRPIAIRPVPTSVRSRLGPFPLRRSVPLVLHRLLQRRKLGRRERFQDRDDRQPAQHQRAVPAYTRECVRERACACALVLVR
jgi:hypothetical protein